ncbi:hypothetical protein [Rhizobium grahamii]|uniref:hypothetical protein n=1 Tax=Rhizobium grahamii TaxID=1120045 RepID=UPI001FCBD3B4|nr:hypothetical protein [Rhizobium grahamii]
MATVTLAATAFAAATLAIAALVAAALAVATLIAAGCRQALHASRSIGAPIGFPPHARAILGFAMAGGAR